MLCYSVFIPSLIVHIQADFPTNLPLVCSSPERREAVEQQLDGLRFKLVQDEIEDELEVFVAERIASRLGAVDIHQAADVRPRGSFRSL